jgi:hypothetical protein
MQSPLANITYKKLRVKNNPCDANFVSEFLVPPNSIKHRNIDPTPID